MSLYVLCIVVAINSFSCLPTALAVLCQPECINGACMFSGVCACNPGWMGDACTIGKTGKKYGRYLHHCQQTVVSSSFFACYILKICLLQMSMSVHWGSVGVNTTVTTPQAATSASVEMDMHRVLTINTAVMVYDSTHSYLHVSPYVVCKLIDDEFVMAIKQVLHYSNCCGLKILIIHVHAWH